MKSQELQNLPTTDFFLHIAEGYVAVDKLKYYATCNLINAAEDKTHPEHCRYRAEIQIRAAARLEAWLKRQVITKLNSI